MKIYIQEEPEIKNLMEEVVMSDMEVIEHDCPFCKSTIRYPVVMRSRTIELFEHYFTTIEKYLKKYGVIDKILTELKDRIEISKIVRDNE